MLWIENWASHGPLRRPDLIGPTQKSNMKMKVGRQVIEMLLAFHCTIIFICIVRVVGNHIQYTSHCYVSHVKSLFLFYPQSFFFFFKIQIRVECGAGPNLERSST